MKKHSSLDVIGFQPLALKGRVRGEKKSVSNSLVDNLTANSKIEFVTRASVLQEMKWGELWLISFT